MRQQQQQQQQRQRGRWQRVGSSKSRDRGSIIEHCRKLYRHAAAKLCQQDHNSSASCKVPCSTKPIGAGPRNPPVQSSPLAPCNYRRPLTPQRPSTKHPLSLPPLPVEFVLECVELVSPVTLALSCGGGELLAGACGGGGGVMKGRVSKRWWWWGVWLHARV